MLFNWLGSDFKEYPSFKIKKKKILFMVLVI